MQITPRDISVVIPVKDGKVFLERAFRSVRAVSHEIEIIFVENGSTDGSLEECQRLADVNTKVIRLSESGVSRARNYGIEAARGKVITTLDADDEMLSGRITFIVSRLWTQTDFVIGTMQLVAAEEPNYPLEIQHALKRGLPLFTGSALIFTKAGFDQIGGYSENLSHAEDMDFILRAKTAGLNSMYSDEQFLIRHFHAGNVSLDRGASISGLFSALRSNIKNEEEKL